MIKINPKQISPWRSALLELLDDGVLSADTLARDLCGWCSEADIKEFCQRNDLLINKDEDEVDE